MKALFPFDNESMELTPREALTLALIIVGMMLTQALLLVSTAPVS